MNLKPALAVVVLTGGALFAVAGTASAATTCVSTTGAKACYDSSDDSFTVTDTAADGHHAAAPWRTDYGRDGICNNYDGSDDPTVPSCNYNFREGTHQVCFRAQTREGTTVIHSSELKCATT